MAGMINQVIDIMNEQCERHSELLGLSHEEKDAIIQNDAETLQKLIQLKQIVISQNNRLEKKRLSLVSDIAEVLGQTNKNPNLGELIALLEGQKEQAMLREVGERLRKVVYELKEANDSNRELLQIALDYVNYSINALSTIVPEPSTMPIANRGVEEPTGSRLNRKM